MTEVLAYHWINVPDQGGWQIAETRDGVWWDLCGSDVSVKVGDSWSGVEAIGSRIERPKEYFND